MIPQLSIANNFLVSRYATSGLRGDFIIDEVSRNDLLISSAASPIVSADGFLRAPTKCVSDFDSWVPYNGPFSWQHGLTISVWAIVEAGTLGNYGYLFSFGSIGDVGWTAVSWGYSGNIQPYFFTSFSSGTSYQQVVASNQSSSIVIGAMDHWAFTMRPDKTTWSDGTTDVRIYRNGLEIGAGTLSGILDGYPYRPLTVGDYGGGGFPTFFDVQDLHIYRNALQPEEIIELFNLGPTRSELTIFRGGHYVAGTSTGGVNAASSRYISRGLFGARQFE